MIRIVAVMLCLLLLPLLAMQFTDEVKWNITDFIIAGIFLCSTGCIYKYVIKKITHKNYRFFITIIFITLSLLVWGELAVGIFGTSWAGS